MSLLHYRLTEGDKTLVYGALRPAECGSATQDINHSRGRIQLVLRGKAFLRAVLTDHAYTLRCCMDLIPGQTVTVEGVTIETRWAKS